METVQNENLKTIRKTLKTAYLFDGFWDRWVVHGLNKDFPQQDRKSLASLENWIDIIETEAIKIERQAHTEEQLNVIQKAEELYRQASLYYNLIYWVFPENCEPKQNWYLKCKQRMSQADELSGMETKTVNLPVDEFNCFGRVRVPNEPKGCVIIINPIDSSKEELYKYESFFNHKHYITVSFDGPGQGETYLNGVIGTRKRWETFIDSVIEYTNQAFPNQNINLFGTSLGASWALYGSGHRSVSNVSVVSPGIELEKMNMPKYFMERMDCSQLLSVNTIPIPNFEHLNSKASVLIFHGGKDPMVPGDEMKKIYNKLPSSKLFIEYTDESHCCNHKLPEILEYSVEWFQNKDTLIQERGKVGCHD